MPEGLPSNRTQDVAHASLASGLLAQMSAPSAWIVSIVEANNSVFIALPSFAVRDTARVVASIAKILTTTNENRARSKTPAVGAAPTPLTASQRGSACLALYPSECEIPPGPRVRRHETEPPTSEPSNQQLVGRSSARIGLPFILAQIAFVYSRAMRTRASSNGRDLNWRR